LIYSTYETLRGSGRAHWTGRTWLVSHFKDVEAGLAHAQFTARRSDRLFSHLFQAGSADPRVQDLSRHLKNWTFFSDPKDMKADRKLIWEILGPDKFAGLPEMLGGFLNDGFLDTTKAGSEPMIDLISSLSKPVRRKILAVMLEVSDVAASEICDLSDPIFDLITASSLSLEAVDRSADALQKLIPLVKASGAMQSPVTQIANGEAVVSQLILLSVVSVFIDKAIANVLQVLLVEPGRWAALHAQSPEHIDLFISEALRLESPTQITSRVVLSDCEFAGEKMLGGQSVSLLIGSANRDEKIFDRAPEFQPLRTTNRTLTFGLGGKRCPGEWLTNNVVKSVLATMLDSDLGRRLAAIKPGSLNFKWKPNQESRRLGALTIQL